MCKKTTGLIVLLCSGTWVQAQQPGYAVVSSGAGNPPEPAVVGGPMGLPLAQGPGGPGYLPPNPYAGMGGPGMGGAGMGGAGMGGPGMAGPGMGYPMGGPGMGGPGMGGPGMAGPGIGYPMGGPGMGPMGGPGMGYPPGAAITDAPVLDGLPTVGPTNTFGTESFWLSMGYAAGWLNKPRLAQPLITEGSTSDAHPGALGQAGTVVAFGDDNYKYGTYNGIIASIGVNLTDEWSLEANGLFMPSKSLSWTVGSDSGGNPLIARPVFNAQAGGIPGAFLTSVPGAVAGVTTVAGQSQIWGVDALAAYRFALTPYLSGQFLFGYRNMELLENLTINDWITPLTPSFTFMGMTVPPALGTQITDYDRFSTNNIFNGGEIGFRFNWQSGYDWFATTAYIKEALGATTQMVGISGATSLVTSGAPTITAPGGVLAQLSNGGNFSRSVFGSITDGGVGIIITPWKYVRFEVGYSAMFWNSVVRPGNQINSNVTFSQVPTSQTFTGTAPGNQPTFAFHQTNITMQTVNVGMTFYY